jgi:S-DNA-T family DNA segregation ATPase FtsK/SpoIIIE
MAGAEKLLGAGDLLFISAEVSKPKRIQGSYISEKEVRKVIDYVKAQRETSLDGQEPDLFENHLAEDLEKTLEEVKSGESFDGYAGGEDPLYEEAKRIVVETRKASASFLQRRLRIGYARAARLLDILEEKGVIGPGEGAKPREVFLKQETKDEEPDDDWQKI